MLFYEIQSSARSKLLCLGINDFNEYKESHDEDEEKYCSGSADASSRQMRKHRSISVKYNTKHYIIYISLLYKLQMIGTGCDIGWLSIN